MNNDGTLMYRLCIAIEDGDASEVAHLRIGPLYGARWLTFGARLLRLYISQPNVSAYDKEVIARMTNYIMKVYFKVCIMHVSCHKNCSCTVLNFRGSTN